MNASAGADERLVVMLEARISEFEKRMQKAERTGSDSYRRMRTGSRTATRQMEQDMVRSTSRINQALASTGASVGGFARSFALGLAGGVVTAAFAGFTSNAAATIKQIAQIGDEAKRAGMSAEAFQEWKYVAEQNRIGIDALTDGFKELSLRADEFVVTGGGSAAEAFDRLGFTAAELGEKLKDPSALMQEIIGRLEGVDKAAQIRISDELFGGTGGEQFVQLLEQGEAGIRGQIERARELGIVMDTDMIAKAAALDAKFGEITSRMSALWQSGVVGAAEFFGFIEQERAKLTYDAEDAKRLLGVDLADMLGDQSEVGQDAIAIIESLKIEYSDLADAARGLVPALADASNMMRGLGNDAAADALADLATRIGDAAREFDDGTISGEEYAAKLREVTGEASATMAAMDELDQITLSGVIGQVSSLLTWIEALPGAAAAARAEIGALEGMTYGTPMNSGDASDLLPPSDLAPTASPRAGQRPIDWMPGDTKPSGGARKGGGGGGGGSNRLDSLIEELLLEEEILTEWYEKSLELLNGATEAQLEAIGGKHEAIERLEREHADRLAAIEGAKNSFSLESALGAGADILGALGNTNKKALKLSQGFAAAEALVSTMKGAAKELEKGTFGFASAAAVIAKGGAFIAAIKGASSTGGGGSGGATGGGGAAAAQAPAGPTQTFVIDAPGMNLEDFVNTFNAAVDAGYRPRIVQAGR